MEGPFIVPFAWFFAVVAVWVYRTFFERVASRSRPFEDFCRSGPTLAVVCCRPGHESALRGRLEALLGEWAVSTLGPLPCPHYRIALSLEQSPGRVKVSARGASLLRPGEARPALLPSLCQAAGEGASLWLDERLYQETLSPLRAPCGWVGEIDEGGRLRLSPAPVEPGLAYLSGDGGSTSPDGAASGAAGWAAAFASAARR